MSERYYNSVTCMYVQYSIRCKYCTWIIVEMLCLTLITGINPKREPIPIPLLHTKILYRPSRSMYIKNLLILEPSPDPIQAPFGPRTSISPSAITRPAIHITADRTPSRRGDDALSRHQQNYPLEGVRIADQEHLCLPSLSLYAATW
jgi:hypothetical protein